MKIHFSGIGGIGISALAQLCWSKGYEIQGSDLSDKSVVWPVLVKKNVKLFTNQVAQNIDNSIDLLVYSEAVPITNAERVRAEKLEIPQKSYFEFLGEVSAEYKTVAVAGTHGKTSTTAMIAKGLQEVGFDANLIVGTTLDFLGDTNFKAGKESALVVEACEYRENFRFLNPEIVVLTSVEWDHIDAFPTEELYFEAFEKFITNTKAVIAHADDEGAQRVLKNFEGKIIWIDNLEKLELSAIGEFNARNARQAKAVAECLNLDIESFAKGLQKYKGSGRRQEFLGEINGINFFDDYAHHPSEISALLTGFEQSFPNAKIGIIFEPHQFSRTKQFFDEFLKALKLADKAVFYPIYAARDTEEDKKFSLIDNIKNTNIGLVENQQDIQKFVSELNSGDVILFCGAGNISAVAHEFIAKNI